MRCEDPRVSKSPISKSGHSDFEHGVSCNFVEVSFVHSWCWDDSFDVQDTPLNVSKAVAMHGNWHTQEVGILLHSSS